VLTTISASELRDDPSARFWALALYIADHPEVRSDPDLDVVGLTFLYDAEIKNGGHLQYFQNHGTAQAPRVVEALKRIGAAEQAALLEVSLRRVSAGSSGPVDSLDAYAVRAAEGTFRSEDASYYALRSEVVDLLEKFLGDRLSMLVGVRSDA
jgi:Domain of unknown function (DUF4375)